ncbi:MAG: o-succinylbenzoate synthase [Synechococcales cyanobacterium C42_A2020_086]|nr:o-succinylbenzoate synthase [Synechococcales cyanobacterium C42_A2020_086]
MAAPRYHLQFRPYRRPFRQPLHTRHGIWTVREGIILCLTDADGRPAWGEIAPVPAFGSETLAQAWQLCQALPAVLTWADLQQIPLPACRFGFLSAWEQLTTSVSSVGPLPVSSVLLPTGAAALEAPQIFTPQPQSTFKWKIGVAPIQDEMAIFEELISLLPADARLRLDANGSLTWQQACQWLQLCDGYGVELLEQPLPPDQVSLMLKLRQRYSTELALDESVTTVAQLQHCYHQGWRGVFVLKAAIAGSPMELRNFCQTHNLDVIWSSVFETGVARRYIQDFLVRALPEAKRVLGFGTSHWFNDGWEQLSPEQLWERL